MFIILLVTKSPIYFEIEEGHGELGKSARYGSWVAGRRVWRLAAMQSLVRWVSQPDTVPSESRNPAAVRRASANASATVASTCSGSTSAAYAVAYMVLR